MSDNAIYEVVERLEDGPGVRPHEDEKEPDELPPPVVVHRVQEDCFMEGASSSRAGL
jgi:hypothetical protein